MAIENAGKEITAILENVRYSTEEKVDKIMAIYNKLEVIDRLDLHSVLSNDQLNKFYPLLSQIPFENEVLEHLYFSYYDKLVINDLLFAQLENDYIKTKFVSLESIFIRLLKQDLLSDEQIQKVGILIDDKEVRKQVFLNRIRNKMTVANLEENEIIKLLEYEEFDLLIEIIIKPWFPTNLLKLFQEPAENEKNKRKKLLLYKKSNDLLRRINS